MMQKKIWIAAAMFSLIACVVFASSAAVAKQLDAWDLLPKPEPYTEFFFNNFGALPASVTPQGTLDADMTIRNMQHEPTVYHYKTTTAAGGDTQQTLKEGKCAAEHGATCTIDGHVTVPALGPRVQIRTTIEYEGRRHDETVRRTHTQSLHYWVTLKLPGGM